MELTRRHFILAVGLTVLAGFWYVRSDRPRASRPTAGKSVIAFGDSLVEGIGATPGHDFVSVLSERLGVSIINAGLRGDTTSSALSRLNQDVLARNPRVVIVLLGGNDFLRRIPKAETFENLETIVARIRQSGSSVVLVGVSVGFFAGKYGAEYEDLARRMSTGLVPDILDDIIGHADLMYDGIHPNDRGYQMMADRLEPVLRDLVQED